MEKVKLIECPRDAMQGIAPFIPTDVKVRYLNGLLKVGFDTIDIGSFVSAKAIPQLADTVEVLARIDTHGSRSRLLVIVANERGAEEAVKQGGITYLGYPFSISETFQQRNTNASIEESLERVEEIQNLCISSGKQLVLYISMGFGNPYGDPWNVDIVQRWVARLAGMGIGIFQLSDTIGVAGPDSIRYLFSHLIPAYPQVEIGAHLHTHPATWREKTAAAYESGCRRFDGAIMGFGGCPMAKDDLTGNMPTEKMMAYLAEQEMLGLNMEALTEAMRMAPSVFPL